MSKDILGMYGPDSPANQKPRATNGGQMECKSLAYSTPVGPKGQSHEGPGLGEDNCGNSVMQGKH